MNNVKLSTLLRLVLAITNYQARVKALPEPVRRAVRTSVVLMRKKARANNEKFQQYVENGKTAAAKVVSALAVSLDSVCSVIKTFITVRSTVAAISALL